MKIAVATIGLVGLLSLAGCGGKPSSGNGFTPPGSSPRTVTWKDGDPLVPACGNSVFNCKKSFTVHDRTTGAQSTLPVTQTSLTPSNLDDYEIRSNGYDWQGKPISSSYVALPK